MRKIILVILLIVAPSVISKIYNRCELAKKLREIPEIPTEHIPIWVCIAYYESRFDTSAIGKLNGNWSWDHGLFQLSDRYWCGRNGRGGACNIACEKLRDENMYDDMKCIKVIYEEHERMTGDGFNAWAMYGRCRGNQAKRFVAGCSGKY